MLAQLRRRAGVWRLVRLTATSRCSTPFTLGSSEICLPDRLFESLTPEERRSVLAHELAHLARRDPLWQLAAALIEAVFFFQPLNRLAALRLREEAEHIADDWAVRQTGSAVGLVRSLAAVAGWLAPDEGLPQATMAMTEGGSGLLRRVERLLTPRSDAWTPGAGVRGLAAAALLVGTVGVAPGIVGRGAEPKSKETFRGDAVEVTRIRRHPDPEEPLARRFEWAQAQARRHGDRDFWVAYECRSVVPPSWAHGAESQRHTESRARPSPDELMIRSARDRSGPTEAPDLVVLLRTRREPDGRLSVIRVAGGTPSVAIDLEGQAAYWLGSAEEHESIDLLASLGRYAADLRVMETLVEIIALHQDSRAVVPYLSHVLDGDDGTDVRGAAVHGLAWHPSPEVTQRLLDTALDDRSGVVQREAAEALGESGVKEAEAALEQIIASRAARVETRAKAVEALGSFRRPDVLRKLVGIAFGSFDPKMQDEAVEAAADIGLPDVPPVMKRVAFQHPDAKVRGEALERLARAGRRADLETLFRVALGDPDSRNQRLATARLADFDLVDAAPFLKRLAWEHRRSAIRCQAVELVGAMPEALGLPLLDELVKRHPDEAVRRQAMAAIAGYLDEPSARRLLEIARHHPSPATRHQALELLIGGSPVASSAGGGRP
jgi:HEAT repeat protein